MNTNWTLSIGLYAGILFGLREYDFPNSKMIVFYLPFVDLALEIEYEDAD